MSIASTRINNQFLCSIRLLKTTLPRLRINPHQSASKAIDLIMETLHKQISPTNQKHSRRIEINLLNATTIKGNKNGINYRI